MLYKRLRLLPFQMETTTQKEEAKSLAVWAGDTRVVLYGMPIF